MARIGPDELSRWFDAHAGAMVLYARQWLDPAAAEDAVQEVFLRLVRTPPAPRHVRAWLFRAVRNTAINRLRSRRRRTHHERTRADAGPAWFDARADDPVDPAAIQGALARLPVEQREVVVLRTWAGMGFEEIAGTVGRPVSTVFGWYRAALTSLRATMRASCNPTT